MKMHLFSFFDEKKSLQGSEELQIKQIFLFFSLIHASHSQKLTKICMPKKICKSIIMQQIYADARFKTTLKQEMKVACLSIFILPLKMSRWNMRCYHSFRLNTKNKFQDKQKMHFHSLKGNQMKTKFKKAKQSFFKKFSSKQQQKSLFKNALNKTETL